VSYPEQLERYKRFEENKKMPVFMAIGTGGKASSPKSLYIIPINELDKTKLKKSEIKQYYKNPESKFYYDISTLRLE